MLLWKNIYGNTMCKEQQTIKPMNTHTRTHNNSVFLFKNEVGGAKGAKP